MLSPNVPSIYYTVIGGTNPGIQTTNPEIPGGKYASIVWPVVFQCRNQKEAEDIATLNELVENLIGFDKHPTLAAQEIMNNASFTSYASRPSLAGPYYPVVWAGNQSCAAVYRDYAQHVAPLVKHCDKRVMRRTERIHEALVYMVLRSRISDLLESQFQPGPNRQQLDLGRLAINVTVQSAPSTPARPPTTNGNHAALRYSSPSPTLAFSAMNSQQPSPPSPTSFISHSPKSSTPYIHSRIRDLHDVVGTSTTDVKFDDASVPPMSTAATEYLDAHGYVPSSRKIMAQAHKTHRNSDAFSAYLSLNGMAYTEARYIFHLLESI